MSKSPEYGSFPANALEEVTVKGVSRMVHPNTAILLRFKGLLSNSKSKKKEAAKPIKEVADKVVKTRKKTQ